MDEGLFLQSQYYSVPIGKYTSVSILDLIIVISAALVYSILLFLIMKRWIDNME
jgi:hypothetical protein